MKDSLFTRKVPNGLRYPRVGGTRQRHFAGTSLEPCKRLENAQTPTRRVHAVLGSLDLTGLLDLSAMLEHLNSTELALLVVFQSTHQ